MDNRQQTAGTFTYWNVDYAPLADAQGAVDGVLVILSDVTEEVTARRRAEEVAARDQAVLAALHEGLLILDAAGTILEFNPAARLLHGLSPLVDRGQPIDDVRAGIEAHYEDGRRVPEDERPVPRLLRGESFRDFEMVIRNPPREIGDGDGAAAGIYPQPTSAAGSALVPGRQWVASYNGSVVRNASGDVHLCILTMRDITAQKEAQAQLAELNATLEAQVSERTAELRSSEMRFRAVFEEAGLGIALVDAHGRILTANRALQRILDADEEALIGRPLAAFSHPEDVEGEADPLTDLHRGGRHIVRAERRYLSAARRLGWANVTGSVVTTADESQVFAIVMFEDITQRKQAEAALIQAERLNAVGELAASLTHEINNPLQAAIGCLQLAAETMAPDDDNLRYLSIAEEELRRAARLVRQLRDLSRPSRSEDRRRVDLLGLLNEIVNLNQRELEARGIGVRLTAEPLEPVLVVPDQIRQVFLNLVLNAMDALAAAQMDGAEPAPGGGGQLALTLAPTEEPPGAVVTVTDTGQGMSQQDLMHAFELFYTTKEDGLGMGLHISRQIVQQHGGTIEVESEVGRGTTFRIWLPA